MKALTWQGRRHVRVEVRVEVRGEEVPGPLRVLVLTTRGSPPAQASAAYEIFQRKRDGAIKILLGP